MTIFTVGHSTRTIQEFLALLLGHGVRQLLDVRSVPRSRTNPQFNREVLPTALEAAGLSYYHLPGLGGRRPTRPDSLNVGWRNRSFRGYADHMQTAVFAEGLKACLELGAEAPTALMCAEAVPWRCHRSLIADALVAHGATVIEIVTATAGRRHTLTSFARVSGRTIIYPAPDLPLVEGDHR